MNMRAVEALGGGGMSEVIRHDDSASQRLISVGYVIATLHLRATNFVSQTICNCPIAVYDGF